MDFLQDIEIIKENIKKHYAAIDLVIDEAHKKALIEELLSSWLITNYALSTGNPEINRNLKRNEKELFIKLHKHSDIYLLVLIELIAVKNGESKFSIFYEMCEKHIKNSNKVYFSLMKNEDKLIDLESLKRKIYRTRSFLRSHIGCSHLLIFININSDLQYRVNLMPHNDQKTKSVHSNVGDITSLVIPFTKGNHRHHSQVFGATPQVENGKKGQLHKIGKNYLYTLKSSKYFLQFLK